MPGWIWLPQRSASRCGCHVTHGSSVRPRCCVPRGWSGRASWNSRAWPNHAPLYLVATSTASAGREPWIGALRNSVVAFAGAVGGADVIQLVPGERLDAMSTNGPRRLACTTPLIAREEASLRRVADPAEGSWFLEAITAAIAGDAWAEVTRLERAGGIVAAMRAGALST